MAFMLIFQISFIAVGMQIQCFIPIIWFIQCLYQMDTALRTAFLKGENMSVRRGNGTEESVMSWSCIPFPLLDMMHRSFPEKAPFPSLSDQCLSFVNAWWVARLFPPRLLPLFNGSYRRQGTWLFQTWQWHSLSITTLHHTFLRGLWLRVLALVSSLLAFRSTKFPNFIPFQVQSLLLVFFSYCWTELVELVYLLLFLFSTGTMPIATSNLFLMVWLGFFVNGRRKSFLHIRADWKFYSENRPALIGTSN